MPRIAFYAGSFDPLTNGHLDVLGTALTLADKVVVAIGIHPGKAPLFSLDERLAMIREAAAMLKAADRVEAISFDGLAVDAARAARAGILIRGVRSSHDFEDEMQMAGMNLTLEPALKTVFLPASPAVRHITASLIRQIAGMGGDVSPFVPKTVAERLTRRFAKPSR